MLKLWYLELSGTLEDIASMYGGRGASLIALWRGLGSAIWWGEGADLFVGAGPGAVCRVVSR